MDIIGQNGNDGLHYDSESNQCAMYERDLDLDVYQQFTTTTAEYPSTDALYYLVLGLVSEAGEVASALKKFIRGDSYKSEFEETLFLELGDVMWYISQLHNLYNKSLNTTVLKNRDKLIDRQNRNKIKGTGDYR